MSFRSCFGGMFLLAFFAFAAGCGGDDGIGVEVRVVSDLVPAREVATVEAQLFRGVANESTTSLGNAERSLAVSDPLSRGLWVVTFEDVAPGVYTVWVKLRRANGEVLATRPLTVTVVDDASYTVTLTADCARAECPSPGGSAAFIACLAGECVDPSCSPETPALCPPDLSLFCVEDGDCMPRSACGTAHCVEGVCLSDAVQSECGFDEFCSPLSGCTAVEPPPEAPVDEEGLCGDPCELSNDQCHYGYYVCTSGADPVCTAVSPREPGLPCAHESGPGTCNENGLCVPGRIDGGIPDSGMTIDAGIDAGTPCADGYRGTVEEGCVDIDECAEDLDGCDALVTCSNTTGSFTCGECPAGYLGSGTAGCSDVNECMYNVCDRLTTCTNAPGSYSCSACPAGYDGTGATGCMRQNGCDEDPCDPLTVCNPTGPGTYDCSACPLGYVGSGEVGCADVNECTYNVCDRLTACTNTPGSYSCGTCPAGYAGSGATGCSDVNECDTTLCAENSRCVNTTGSYRCDACPSGFASDGSASACVDVNECDSNPCDELTTCTNRPGGFVCSACPSGYSGSGLAGCNDINECAANNGGCGPVTGATCTNTAGSRTCSCKASYRAVGDTCVPTWSHDTYVKATNAEASDIFGSALAISDDGLVLAIGAPAEDGASTGIGGDQTSNTLSGSGAVYLYRFVAGVWTPEAYIKASNAEASDFFGIAVSLSADGSVLAVGAKGEDSEATGVNGDQAGSGKTDSGAVYVFRRTDGVWSQEAYIKSSRPLHWDEFGVELAISNDGNVLAVGSYSENQTSSGINGNQNTTSVTSNWNGAAFVFRRTDGVWAQEAYIKSSNNTGGWDYFGLGLALSGDGNTLAVGAPREDSAATNINGDQSSEAARDSGAVYVFRYASGAWSQEAYVKASNTGVDDQFGYDVALSEDGNVLVVTAPEEDGAARGINGDQSSNALSNSGATYVLRRDGSTWSHEAYIKTTSPTANVPTSVDISRNGLVIALGVSGDDSIATGVGGDQTNDLASASGAVFLFRLGDDGWWQESFIKAPNTEVSDAFGGALCLSGGGARLVVGASAEDGASTGIGGVLTSNAASAAGAAYVYEWTSPVTP